MGGRNSNLPGDNEQYSCYNQGRESVPVGQCLSRSTWWRRHRFEARQAALPLGDAIQLSEPTVDITLLRSHAQTMGLASTAVLTNLSLYIFQRVRACVCACVWSFVRGCAYSCVYILWGFTLMFYCFITLPRCGDWNGTHELSCSYLHADNID